MSGEWTGSISLITNVALFNSTRVMIHSKTFRNLQHIVQQHSHLKEHTNLVGTQNVSNDKQVILPSYSCVLD